jgi:hypothetical protein
MDPKAIKKAVVVVTEKDTGVMKLDLVQTTTPLKDVFNPTPSAIMHANQGKWGTVNVIYDDRCQIVYTDYKFGNISKELRSAVMTNLASSILQVEVLTKR